MRSVPRRGIYVVRKTKTEVIEMITAWARAREAWPRASSPRRRRPDQIAALRKMFTTFEGDQVRAHLDEYSEVNIEFHQTIVKLSGNVERPVPRPIRESLGDESARREVKRNTPPATEFARGSRVINRRRCWMNGKTVHPSRT